MLYEVITMGWSVVNMTGYPEAVLAAKVPADPNDASDEADMVEGYHVYVGGGFGPDAAIAREIYRDVKAQDAPYTVERLLKIYQTNRANP